MRARATLLGPPTVRIEGDRHELAAGKGTALVAYLAWRGGWVGRDEVAALLWPDRPDTVARRNLRQALFRLSREPLGATLEVEPARLRFAGDCDVADLRAALGPGGDPATAVRLGARTLLEGWSPVDAPEVERWIAEARDELQRDWHRALAGHARDLADAGSPLEAARWLGHAWRRDVLDEEALDAQLALLVQAGRSDEAEREARTYAASFERQLGFPPDRPPTPRSSVGGAMPTATAGATAPSAEATPLVVVRPPPLPTPTTPFVGRAAELADLLQRLRDPAARLVSLVGIGGAGKTRLALEAARRLAVEGEAIAWVGLASRSGDASVPAAIARGFGLGAADAATLPAVAEALGDRPARLVLDNAEHVRAAVGEAAAWLLAACPALRVLITSRRPLEVRGETAMRLDGLARGEGVRDDAAAFFLAAARRVRPELDAGRHAAAIEALCAEVGGLPLALEILASWADVLDPPEMLDEVRAGLEILSSTSPDLPERQRGLRTVLASTAERLGPAGRRALTVLAPFEGGFDLAAARAVGVTPRGLQELVRAAWLQRADGRFAPHPLAQRFARERAAALPSWTDVRARHARLYLARLEAQVEPLLRQSGVGPARALYVRDLANLRAALRWASETMDARSFAVMHEAYDVLTWTFTGERDATFVREAAEHATGPVRDHLAVSHLADRLEAPSTATHELPAMEEELRVIATRAQRTDDTVLAIRAQWILADAALRVGGPGRAEPPARAAVRALDRPSRAWERIDRVQLAYAWRLLAKVAEASGRYGAARHDLLRSIALFRSVGDPGLPELSRTLRLDVAYGRYAAARRAAGAAHRCLPPDAPGPARTHVAADRARLAVALGEIDAARAACGEGLAIAAGLLGEIRERYLATLHGLLAHAALLAGEVEAAERHLALAPLDAANRARRADTLLLRGDSHAALDDLDHAAERVTAPALQPFLHGYVAGLRVRALEAAGREGEATEAALAALRWARGSGMPPEIARAVVGAAGRLSDDAATPREAALREVAGDPRSDATGRRWARAALRSAGRTLAPHDAAAVPALLDELERALAALAAAGGSAPARSASSQRSPAVG